MTILSTIWGNVIRKGEKWHALAFLLLAAASTCYLSTKPRYGWDTLAYMAIVVSYDVKDPVDIHHRVFKMARIQIPVESFDPLVSSNPDRERAYRNPEAFNRALSFFRVKPLYTLSIYGIHKAGVPLVQACFLPGLFAYFAITCLAYWWSNTIRGPRTAWFVGVLVLIFPPLLDMCREPTPNALSSVFLLMSLAFFGTGKKIVFIWVCIFLAVLTRLDHLLFATIFFVFSNYNLPFAHRKMTFRWTITLGLAVSVAAAGILLFPLLLGNEFSWFTKFSHLQSTQDYVRMVPAWMHAMVFSFLPLLAGLVIYFFRYIQLELQAILVLAGVVIAIRLLLFPSFQERFFVIYEIAGIIALLTLGFPKRSSTLP